MTLLGAAPRAAPWTRLQLALALGGGLSLAAAALFAARRVLSAADAAATGIDADAEAPTAGAPPSGALFCLLVDNGSLRAASVAALRALAAAVEARAASTTAAAATAAEAAEAAAAVAATAAAAAAAARAAASPTAATPVPPTLTPLRVRVIATSARISDRIVRGAELEAAGGAHDLVVQDAVARLWTEAGARRFVVLPAFVGPSETVTDFVPRLLDRLRDGTAGGRKSAAATSNAADTVAAALPPLRGLSYLVARPAVVAAETGDMRVAGVLADHVRAAISAAAAEAAAAQEPPPLAPNSSLVAALASGELVVAVCDHGSPSAAVAAVRDHVATQLRALLLADGAGDEAGAGAGVIACSMERRAGAEYDFCEPSLAGVLRSARASEARLVIVALLFIAPGKHAGPGGDIAEIVAAAQAERTAAADSSATAAATRQAPRRIIVMTRLLGEHPAFADVLAGRLDEVLRSLPASH